MTKKKMLFLTLAAGSLIVLAPYLISDMIIDHSKEICYVSQQLDELGLKDAAINHQVNAINRMDGYSAEHVKELEEVSTHIVERQKSEQIREDEVFVSDEMVAAYDWEGDTATMTYIKIDEHISVINEDLPYPYKLKLR